MTKRLLLSATLGVAILGCQTSTPNTDQPARSAATLPTSDGPVRPATVARRTPTSRPLARAELQRQLAAILNRHADKGAWCAARVIDPQTGEELFSQDADKPVTPASNMKIPTCAAAFEMFGPDYVMQTPCVVVGDDLYVIGTGDPSLGDLPMAKDKPDVALAFMDKWADELKAMGKSHLTGKLYYVDSAFEKQQISPDWSKGDLLEWYGAPVSALNLNDNCVDITAVPAAKPGEPATLTIFPPTSHSITIINHTTTVDPATTKPTTKGGDITRAADSNTYTITGNIWTKVALDSKPVTDPSAFFADALLTRLAKDGVTIDGGIAHDTRPISAHAGGRELTPAKTKFSDMLARLLKSSQNLFAEVTAKLEGRFKNEHLVNGRLPTGPGLREQAVEGSYANAESVIRTFLRGHHIDDSQYVFADGSGLSSRNKVTTRMISDIFATMMKDPAFDTWEHCLTIAGVDGTTRKRLLDHPGQVFCKTGFISGVRSLSGYVVTDRGRTLVFSFIYNGITPRGSEATKPYEACQDDALRLLMWQ